jgi:hypothetical protein
MPFWRLHPQQRTWWPRGLEGSSLPKWTVIGDDAPEQMAADICVLFHSEAEAFWRNKVSLVRRVGGLRRRKIGRSQ